MNGQDFSVNIEKSTSEYRKLFLNKNFETLSDFASPKLIEHLDTKQNLIFLLTELDKTIESKGAKISEITFGKNTEIIKHKNQLQCIIPFNLEIEDAKKKVFFKSGLALVSFDKGETWLFTFKVEKEDKLNNEILDLEGTLVIPERSRSIINK